MKKSAKVLFYFVTSGVLVTGFQNCSSHLNFSTAGLDANSLSSSSSGTSTTSSTAVCNPFGSTTATTTSNGLSGTLYYQDRSNIDSSWTALDYVNKGLTYDNPLYFNNVDMPDQSWSAGFALSNGTLLQDNAGDTLMEWFAIDYRSNIVLQSTDSAGQYQFEISSDDGSLVYLDTGSGPQLIINNDGTHSMTTQDSATITLAQGTSYPIRIVYFQGPRYEMGNILQWRKVNADGSTTDWEPVPNANFVLSGGQVNPCVD